MALVFPCTFYTSLQRLNFPINRRFRRRATTCEFRIPVEISSPTDRGSLLVPSHKVTVHDRQRGIVHEFEVPEDQYILHSAEAQNISLPFACRHGKLTRLGFCQISKCVSVYVFVAGKLTRLGSYEISSLTFRIFTETFKI